ncbi:SDR family NAD(P)-dependent oxidoreductase [Actinomadura sp. KC345]|uniref:SDR family NAD(P)-dependent oxidoreductase n=1 Tax=Actinomadura sp. KC345 TaxID=2530371 RepID=UPI001A9DEEC9|nr:SDR family NAD(P)-dependent oxidoreductase [Actinomadura sp. KC345]
MTTVVITGGTRGIGLGLARKLLARDARVAICGRSRERVDKAVAVNLLGVLHGSAVAVAGMTRQGGGTVWNMAGLGDGRTVPGLIGYGATKRGTDYLTTGLAKEVEGGPVKVAHLSPGMVVTDLGFTVDRIVGLKCPTAVSIAHVTEDELRSALRELASGEVDALVQCGTNLSMVGLADEAERWLGLPVIAINAAT